MKSPCRVAPYLLVLLCILGGFSQTYAVDNDGDLLDDTWETANGFSPNAHAFNDLLGWWQANESSGAASADRSSHLLDLSVENYASGFWTTGLFGNAATLNGSNQSLTAAQNGNYNLTDYTFSVWVKTSTTSGQTLARWLDANGDGWQIAMDSSGALSVRYDTSTTSNQTFQHGTAPSRSMTIHGIKFHSHMSALPARSFSTSTGPRKRPARSQARPRSRSTNSPSALPAGAPPIGPANSTKSVCTTGYWPIRRSRFCPRPTPIPMATA